MQEFPRQKLMKLGAEIISPPLRAPLCWLKFTTVNEQNPEVKPELENGADPMFLTYLSTETSYQVLGNFVLD